MKKIGLVGGTGPESTIMYYKELNSKIDEATGGKNMPELSIESVNFRRAWELVSSEQHKELADYLFYNGTGLYEKRFTPSGNRCDCS